MSSLPPQLSIVVPLYNSAETLPQLVAQLSSVQVAGGIEIVLVNDGSTDSTETIASALLRDTASPALRMISLSRNFGEHNAVLEGLRASKGMFVITMDDDLQNPPSEVTKLLKATQNGSYEVVYSVYSTKMHSWWRNAGSTVTNTIANWTTDKPRGLYFSSFRCLSRFVVDEVALSRTPYPYIDGLICQITQNIGVIEVRHDARSCGESGYTMRRLLRLWLSMLINGSVLPLRVATLVGIASSGCGFIGLLGVFAEHFTRNTPLGWGSLMAGLLLFSGVQLLMLGVMGEYVGRTYLGVSGKPQAIVRRRASNAGEGEGSGRVREEIANR